MTAHSVSPTTPLYHLWSVRQTRDTYASATVWRHGSRIMTNAVSSLSNYEVRSPWARPVVLQQNSHSALCGSQLPRRKTCSGDICKCPRALSHKGERRSSLWPVSAPWTVRKVQQYIEMYCVCTCWCLTGGTDDVTQRCMSQVCMWESADTTTCRSGSRLWQAWLAAKEF